MTGLLRDRYFEYAPDQAWDLMTGAPVSSLVTSEPEGPSTSASAALVELFEHGVEGAPRWIVADATAAEWVEQSRMAASEARRRGYVAIGPEAEAQKASQAYWDEKMSEPVGEDGDVDPGSIADDANDKAIETYELLFPLRRSALNLGTASLFHLFEQTSISLGRDWKRGDCKKLEHFLDWLRDVIGIDARAQTMWLGEKLDTGHLPGGRSLTPDEETAVMQRRGQNVRWAIQQVMADLR